MHSLWWMKMRKITTVQSKAQLSEVTLMGLEGYSQKSEHDTGKKKKEPKRMELHHTCNSEYAELSAARKKMKGDLHIANQDKGTLSIFDNNAAESLQAQGTICSNKRRVQHKGSLTICTDEKRAHQGKGILTNCDSSSIESQNNAGVARSLIASLKACTIQKDLHRGSILHKEIIRRGLLKTNVFVGSTVINMYAKCGALEKAQEVFNELPIRNAVSWTALLAGYAQHGHAEEALNCFEQMQLAGFSPDSITFACALKACGSIGASSKGEEIHAQIVKERLLGKHMLLSNTLIDMYAKCGALEKAQEVFDKLLIWNTVSWNVLIAGYSQHGHGKQALDCFEEMQLKGFSPNAITFTCILKSCGSIGALDKGKDIHNQIKKEHLLGSDVVLASALVDMYAKCRALDKAQEVFDELPARDVVSWNALIGGYAQHGDGERALSCFKRMQLAGFFSNEVTFACILKACGSIGALEKGQEIHAQIVGMLGKHVMVYSALVDMYIQCGAVNKAQEVFDELTVRDVVLWNTLIAGYAQYGHSEEALSCFERMQEGGFSPDAVTFACVLKSCGSIGALNKGEEIHGQVVKEHLLDKHVVANALVYMYAKNGAFEKAQEVLANLPVRDTISWTALITGYSQHELNEDALNCFESMQLDGFAPDAFTFACVLKACGSIGAAYKGQILHSEIVKLGILEQDIIVATALVVMYANCGMLGEAQQLYGKLLVWDVALWSVIMVGYAQLGRHTVVFHLFDKMVQEDIKPDSTTFTIVLNTCSHCGLMDEGQMYFETISKGYRMIPTLEHHTCLVDLFGRVDRLDKAVVVIEEMPHYANLTTWLTLLGACQKWGNVKLGSWAFKHAVQLDGKDSAAYVCMGNIYAATGRQEDARKVKALSERKSNPVVDGITQVDFPMHSFC